MSRGANDDRERPAPAAPAAPPWRDLLLPVAVPFVVGNLLASVVASQIYLGMLDHGHAWWRIFAWQASAWYLWTLFTPAVVWLARRLPLDRPPHRVRNLLVHVPLSALFALGHLVPFAWLTARIEPYTPVMDGLPFGRQYAWLFDTWFRLDLVVYWAILGVAHAWDLSRRYREREVRAAQLEGLLATARLQALQLQLQPHFLFNALNAVSGLVRRGENPAAVRMIAGLSDLLRYVLASADRQTVPLAEELTFVERYLDVQRARFGDRLTAALDAAPDTLALEVPALILQPLVENAVEHGLARRAGPGHLEVTARREGDRLVVRLRDDGRGLAAGGGSGGRSGGGLGLDNSRARLSGLYGDAFELTLRDVEGGPGAVATLVVPARPAEASGGGGRPADASGPAADAAAGAAAGVTPAPAEAAG